MTSVRMHANWLRSGACLLAVLAILSSGQAAEPRVERGVVYGEAGGESLRLDVYQPAVGAGDGSAPSASQTKRSAVVLVHGGGWEGGERTAKSMVDIAKALAEAGYVAFSIDYRLVKLAPDGKQVLNAYPAAIDDCRRAVRWVRRHADKYGIDPNKLGACGDSAGGHLVALLGTTDVRDDSDPELAAFSSRVQAVVDIFGPADLTQDFSQFRIFGRTVQELVDRFVGPGNVAAQRAASPIMHIDDKTAAFLIFHGTEDPLVPIAQSQAFHEALRQAGRPSVMHTFAGQGHGFNPETQQIVIAKTVAFFDAQLKSGDGNAATPAVDVPAEAPQPKPAATDWGAIFKMHYLNRVKMFREQNQIFRNVVLIGDSITEGFDVETYFPGRRILNRGIGADVIGNEMPADDPRGVLQRLDASLFNCAATDVFLMIGINDLNSGRTPDVMEPGYRELFRRMKEGAPQVRVHIQSLLPTRGNHAARNPDVRNVNAMLKRMADEFGSEFIDLHSLMIDADGQLKAEYTEDGLHLTAPAYEVWQAQVIRSLGWKTPTP